MYSIDRLPAIPLIASDPYLSIWMPADTMTQTDACHWSGPAKPIRGVLTVDGVSCRFLGAGPEPAAELTGLKVTATRTRFVSVFGGVELETTFAAPALPDDMDLLSMPLTLVRFAAKATDGRAHDVQVRLHLSDKICYDGEIRPDMVSGGYTLGSKQTAFIGQENQKPLCHSADHITIDWGYLYLSADGVVKAVGDGVQTACNLVPGGPAAQAIIAYDDIASINYFGSLCKAWYRRDGRQITDAILYAQRQFDEILQRCAELDARVSADALAAGGQDYEQIANAAWRHTFAAHKLIATPGGEMAFLSKENDSNGCIGTVDVSYPSIPLFLRYCPELVNALCRPVLEFASMPVWDLDFAPHDVGRYPLATGQVYAARQQVSARASQLPYYLYPAGADVWDPRYQMPVEECGNMLIMLEAARAYGADKALAEKYRPLLDIWVKYLVQYGEDPDEQLCTDDFAGHLAHNANLAAKAIVGVACYARLIGSESSAAQAKTMAAHLLKKLGGKGNTPLTLDGQGWSMKYNLLWDKVLGLGLLPAGFYAAETASYLPRINTYGLPLDSRADYTKSDWLCWTARMADDPAVRAALRYIDRHIDQYTLAGWAQMRWFECLIPIWWLYERQPEEWLVHLVQKLQAQGFDWFSFFDEWPYKAPQEKGRWSQMSHTVNNMMMLKSGALYGRLSGQKRHRLFAERALKLLDRYHGMVTGVVTGDECLSGKSPVQGTELCAVSELLYTLEVLLSVTGDAKWADRWERVAYNALPAAFSPDMWAHQYDQQVNQVEASVQKDPIFRTNGPDANIYGLEPHFGCCTVNLSQAWPKFAASLILRALGGLAVCGYAPCAAETTVEGVPLVLRIDSGYPFRDSVCITAESARPVCFELLLRRPGYAGRMFVNDAPVAGRDWVRLPLSGTKNVLQIRFVWETLQETRPEGMTAITRGPLVFAAAIQEEWRQLPSADPLKAFPHCDYEVLPQSEWRYALTNAAAKNSVLQTHGIGAYPFSPQGAGLSMTVPAVLIAWDMPHGAAAYPVLPRRTGKDTVIRLLPYGCTNLRITEFPLITDDAQ